jgi:hypothetical protein
MKRILFFLFALTASACENMTTDADSPADPDAARVFNVTKSAAANNAVVTGIWEGARPQSSGALTSTSRFEFRDSFVVAAARCTREGSNAVVAGGRASATVSNEIIEIRESITDQRNIGTGAACAVSASAGVLPVCDPNSAPAQRSTCFELTGTTLDIYQGSGNITSFVKISD